MIGSDDLGRHLLSRSRDQNLVEIGFTLAMIIGLVAGVASIPIVNQSSTVPRPGLEDDFRQPEQAIPLGIR
ncbi:MAG: hypothetical protein R3D80_13325 [Paracoccaceae bacterium]